MKEAFEKMTGMPDAWTNPALMVSRNAFIQGWEARAQHDVDATIIQYHEATIKRLEKRIEALAQPAQEPVAMLERDPSIGRLRVTYEDAVTELEEGVYPLYTTPPTQPAQEPDYAYPTIEEYEEITGFKVNDTFRMGWAMARTTNDLFKQMEKNSD